MKTINAGAYRVYVGNDILNNIPGLIRENLKREDPGDLPVFIVTDRNVARLYLKPVIGFLKKGGFRVKHCILPAGEGTKNFKHLSRLLNEMVNHGLTRDSLVAALGGGVIGDITGFAASVYMRGCRLIQIPTTLLAQADSSIGGKTGINLPQGKNLIGSFYNPLLVASDLSALRTLPERELVSGFAEVLKYGIIFHRPLFEKIERVIGRERDRGFGDMLLADTNFLEEVITRSVKIKAEIVRADERENDLRMILNFGHTFGHAIEQLTGYRRFLHGEAVLLGMETATLLSVKRGLLGKPDAQRIQSLLDAFSTAAAGKTFKGRTVSKGGMRKEKGRPTERKAVSLRGLTAKAIYRQIGTDKKKRGGAVHYILLKQIGYAVPETDVRKKAVLESITETLSRHGVKF